MTEPGPIGIGTSDRREKFYSQIVFFPLWPILRLPSTHRLFVRGWSHRFGYDAAIANHLRDAIPR